MNAQSSTYGREVRRRRLALGLSQGRLSAVSEVSQAYISAIEGGYAHPSVTIRERILRALNTAPPSEATT